MMFGVWHRPRETETSTKKLNTGVSKNRVPIRLVFIGSRVCTLYAIVRCLIIVDSS